MAAAVATLLACQLAAPALAQSQGHHGGGGGGGHGGDGAGWSRGGGGGPRGGPGPGLGREAVGGPPGGPRGGPGPSWDQRRYNGYWVGGRWYYGAPEPPAFENPGFRPGFTPWRRGSFLPPAYQSYVVYDFQRFHLRRPPYGYNWVQVGDEFLLVSVSTGLIFDVVQGG